MAQFDVYENQNAATCQSIPYLLDVQVDLLNALGTRVVVPLVTASSFDGHPKKTAGGRTGGLNKGGGLSW
jgi:hypothetical protein